MGELLSAKRERSSRKTYQESLEKNIVFLHYFVEEGRSLIELMLRNVNQDEKFLEADPGLVLSEIENRLREETGSRHRKVFLENGESEFAEISAFKEESPSRYKEKLEFYYSYLMALRNLMVDFMNILFAVQREYRIENIGPDSPAEVWGQIEMMANYYIGNIKVQESSGRP
jgi:hypothetical protein